MTLSYSFFSRKNVISCFFEGITKNYHTNDKNFSQVRKKIITGMKKLFHTCDNILYMYQ